MPYCTSAQVSSEFKDITFSSSSTVTSDDVTRFIEEADAEIDARVGLKYAVPVTGTDALIIIRSISIGIVAGRIKEILKVATGNDKIDANSYPKDLAKEARGRLDRIVAGTLLLSDGTLLSTTEGFRSYGADVELENTFSMDSDGW